MLSALPNDVMSKIQSGQLHSELFWRRHSTLQSHGLFALAKLLFVVVCWFVDKVIKLYAWELSFQEKIAEIRQKELQTLKIFSYLEAIQAFSWTCAPFLVNNLTICFVLIFIYLYLFTLLPVFIILGTFLWYILAFFLSSRQHLSGDDCLKDKRED